MGLWPPQLLDFKTHLGIPDNRDDAALTQVLDAAAALVERELWGDFDFDGGELDEAGHPLPTPTPDVTTGVLYQAARWWSRRRSPDGLVVDASELGSARVPSLDSDIERMLGVGRWRRPMV